MNEPIGRFGSCSPARARRTAVDTALTASAWPTTRVPICSSMRRSFSFSPSSMRSTGMPVQRETTCAMWLAVTASSTMAPRRVARMERTASGPELAMEPSATPVPSSAVNTICFSMMTGIAGAIWFVPNGDTTRSM